MKAHKLKFDTNPDDLKIGEAAWDSSRSIKVIQLWEGQIWNFYAPAVDMHRRAFTKVESSVFVPRLIE